jgi:HD-GYP domain-containing protein (c-di-GMP phosphodiesterase class II)
MWRSLVSQDTDLRPTTGRAELTASTGDEVVWRAYPMAVRLIRAFVLVVPVVVSAGAVFLLDRALPAPSSWEGYAGFAAVNVLAVFVVVCLVNRLAVRLLPLATLLSLSLVFPDRAPRRFKIALRANSSTQMRSRMLAEPGRETDVASALENLLVYLAVLGRHDRMTRGHCERVRAFVDLLAVEMGLSESDQLRLRWAALLHDIGKLEVPARILRKPGAPTKHEWETLKQHPVDGEKLVRPLAPWLGPWELAVEQHHERIDGSGYPKGLAGTDISLGGRIVAVADAYEVMITSRPYKRPVRPEAARRELVRFSGEQFDPDVVRAFLRIAIGDLRKATGLLGVLAQVPILATVPRAEALIEMAGRQTMGIVGTAAGTGAIVAATTLSPMPAPTSAPPNTSAVPHSSTAVGVPERAAPDPRSQGGTAAPPATSPQSGPLPDGGGPSVEPRSDQGQGNPLSQTGRSSSSGLATAVTKTADGVAATAQTTVGSSATAATSTVSDAASGAGTTAQRLTSAAGGPIDEVVAAAGTAAGEVQHAVDPAVSDVTGALPATPPRESGGHPDP